MLDRPFVLRLALAGALSLLFAFGLQAAAAYELAEIPSEADRDAFVAALEGGELPIETARLVDEIQATHAHRQQLGDLAGGFPQAQLDQAVAEGERGIEASIGAELAETGGSCQTGFPISRASEQKVVSAVGEAVESLNRVLARYGRWVGATAQPLPVPYVDRDVQCQAYFTDARAAWTATQRRFLREAEKLGAVEEEKLASLPAVASALGARLESLERELERPRSSESDVARRARAAALARNMWLTAAVLGAFSTLTLLCVRLFRQDLQRELFESGQVTELVTVPVVLVVLLAVGLTGLINEATLGALLGGVLGYVLAQRVARTSARRREAAVEGIQED